MEISEELKHDLKVGERKAEAFAFYLSVWWRVFYGFASLVLGIGLLWLNGWMVSDVFAFLTRSELVEDPNDMLFTFLGSWLGESQTQITLFSAVYLMFWGLLDMFLYISILLKKMWAYTTAIYLISVFSLYIVYRLIHTGSWILFGLLCFDILIIWLTYRERQRVHKEQGIIT